MDAHYIVTNSYSCGIGEQNQNALMMEVEKTYIMETIKKEEMLSILGGYDDAKCKELQKQAQTEEMSEEEWEIWLENFDKYCM